MKTILIIQSIVILAGAYYIYTLRQGEGAKVMEPVVVEEMDIKSDTDTSVATSSEEEKVADVETKSEIAGPNDAGMEWPVFEGDLESR